MHFFTDIIIGFWQTLAADIGCSMLIGLAIATLFSGALPEHFFASYLVGGAGIVAMLVMLAAGIPVYVCATSPITPTCPDG